MLFLIEYRSKRLTNHLLLYVYVISDPPEDRCHRVLREKASVGAILGFLEKPQVRQDSFFPKTTVALNGSLTLCPEMASCHLFHQKWEFLYYIFIISQQSGWLKGALTDRRAGAGILESAVSDI